MDFTSLAAIYAAKINRQTKYVSFSFQHSLTCAQTTDIKLFKKCISTLQVDLYRFDKRKRESVQPMIEARVYNGVGYIENCIYVAGGNNRDKYLNSVERYA